MGDLFGNFIQRSWIQKVLNHIDHFPEADFLLLTKNPKRYHEFIDRMPKNAILGTTIETNIDRIVEEHNVSISPLPSKRYEAMKNLSWNKKMISIEPILEFDLNVLSQWVEDIQPFIVYVGYDNYNGMMPEPLQEKTSQLIKMLSSNRLVIKKRLDQHGLRRKM